MRTIAIVFALAVVGATAPAAPYGLGRLSLALLVFGAALIVLLAACLVTGWFLSELRTLMRMPSGGPAGGWPSPVVRSAFRLARTLSADGRRRVARVPQASVSRSRSPYPVRIEH